MKGYFAIGIALLVSLSFFQATTLGGTFSANGIQKSTIPDDWFDSRWHNRLLLRVSAGDYVRQNYPVDIILNFSPYIASTDIIDVNSMRVMISEEEIPSEYHPSTAKSGNLIFVVNTTIAPLSSVDVVVYFDVEANGLKPVPDYGEPSYVEEYEEKYEFFKGIGSSPDNGSLATWFFPSFLTYDDYHYGDKYVGDVRAWYSAWGDGWDGAKWIRHYGKATIYRGSFVAYVEVWNNVTTNEVAWASGLANISTGKDDTEGWKDTGLHVITDDWAVNDISALGYSTYGSVMASNTIDTYNPVIEKSFEITADGVHDEFLIEPQTDSAIEILSVESDTDGIVNPSEYELDTMGPDTMSSILFDTIRDEDEVLTVNYTVKTYDFDDQLTVQAKKATTDYVIMYDSNDKNDHDYDYPQVASIIIPEQIALSDMVFEFWENLSARAPGPAFYDYYLNLTTNANDWWYNTTLEPDALHDPQENAFSFILSYLNGSIGCVTNTVNLKNSYNNPADVDLIEQEDATPISITVHAPESGDYYSMIDMPGFPATSHILINLTVTGDTLDKVYYKVSAVGTEVEYFGEVNVTTDSVESDWAGNAKIWIIARDTNGTRITVEIPIKVSKTYFQALLSMGEAFISLVILVGIFAFIFVWLGALNIKKRKHDRNLIDG